MKPAVGLCLVCAVLSGCAIGVPQRPTDVSTTSATLRGEVYSNVTGVTEYWFVYDETATTHRTVFIDDTAPHAVSEPISGLTPNTTYQVRLCAADEEEAPPRVNCSKARLLHTGDSAGGGGEEVMSGTTTFAFQLDARGGSSGEIPRGTATWRYQRGSQPTATVSVTCLAVDGTTAIVGFTGLLGGPVNGKSSVAGRIRVVEAAGNDTFEYAYTSIGPGVDWEAPDPPPVPGPTDCSTFPGPGAGNADTRTITNGGAEVTDVAP